MVLDLVPLWTVLLGLAVFYYVVFDGFDLGVGILYGLAPGDRAIVMNAIAPIWDGNETWLVFGGLGLLAAFPLAFAIIIPAVYFPILIMLLALVFRGVALNFDLSIRLCEIFGIAHSAAARLSPLSPKVLSSARSSRALRWTAGSSPELRLIG